MADLCPKCGSANVAVGNFPLNCSDCGWSYLNKHPCEVCGAPSTSFTSALKEVHYRCSDHGLTTEENNGIMRRFFREVLNRQRRVEEIYNG